MKWMAKVPLLSGGFFHGYGKTPEAAVKDALNKMRIRNELQGGGKIACEVRHG